MQSPNKLKTPAWMQKIHWVADPVSYVKHAAQEYPDLFTAEVIGFGDKVVFISHPKAIQEVLSNDREKFVALSQGNRFLEPVVGESSIVMLEGKQHWRRRKLLIPPLHGQRMHVYGKLISDLTNETFEQLPKNKTFLATTITQKISARVILEAVFGLSPANNQYQAFERLLMAAANMFQSPFAAILLHFTFLQWDFGKWSPWGRFLRLQQELDNLIYSEIATRRAEQSSNGSSTLQNNRFDILSLLMMVQDEQGEKLTDREIRCELLTLLLAGQESTASAMAWELYWTYRLPHIRERLLQELNSLSDPSDIMSIIRLPYLTAVCNETLRIAPSVMVTFPRIAQEPVELLGHKLAAGTVVLCSLYLTHHREDLYPQSQEFKPERFLEKHQFSPYEFMPFGNGARGCIGGALAQFEMKLVLATSLLNYQLELVNGRPERLRRRGVTLAPASGVKMKFTSEK